MLRNRRFLIGLAIAIIFLFLFLYRTDFGEMRQALAEANYLYLIPGILIYLIGVYFRALRWSYLLRPLHICSSIRLFPLVVIGFMVNNILPGRLGVVARAYILGEKECISKMAVGGTMIVEQIFDGVTLIFFAAIISLIVPLEGLVQNAVNVGAGLFLGALIICFILASSPRLARKAISLVLPLFPGRWRGRAEEWLNLLITGLSSMRSPVRLIILLTISIPVWICEAGLFYMVAEAFDLRQPFHAMLLVTSVASLSWALIFVAPGGVGPFDFFCKETLMILIPTGIIASEYEHTVTAYVVVLHAMLLLPMITLGFVFLWMENLSLARITLNREGLNGRVTAKK